MVNIRPIGVPTSPIQSKRMLSIFMILSLNKNNVQQMISLLWADLSAVGVLATWQEIEKFLY
jgi:hypothetical protein